MLIVRVRVRFKFSFVFRVRVNARVRISVRIFLIVRLILVLGSRVQLRVLCSMFLFGSVFSFRFCINFVLRELRICARRWLWVKFRFKIRLVD